jgi:hypothetical protein
VKFKSHNDQYRFDYFKPNNHEDDETLDPNITVNVDNEIISHAPEFRNASGSTFVISHGWALGHRHLLEGSNLEAGQIFGGKNKLVNAIKQWHIAHLVEY